MSAMITPLRCLRQLTSAKDGSYLHSTTTLPDTAAFKAIRKQASPRRPTVSDESSREDLCGSSIVQAILTPPTSAVKVEPSSPPLRSIYDPDILLEQSPSKPALPRSRRAAAQQARLPAPKPSGSTIHLPTLPAATTLGQQFQGNISRNVSMDAWQRGTGVSMSLVYALKATGITSPAMFLDMPFENWDKRHREGGLNLTRGQISELRLCGEMWASGQMLEPLRQMRTRAMYGKGRGYPATPKTEAFY